MFKTFLAWEIFKCIFLNKIRYIVLEISQNCVPNDVPNGAVNNKSALALAANMRQAITWTNDDYVLRHHMARLGHDEIYNLSMFTNSWHVAWIDLQQDRGDIIIFKLLKPTMNSMI